MRLLRWSDRLYQYNFNVVYRPGKHNSVADLLSRAGNHALSKTDSAEVDADIHTVNTIFGASALRAITPSELATETQNDDILIEVFMYITTGWPKKRPEDTELHAFFQIQNELTTANECIYRGNRAVIPASLRNRVLQIAHEGHCGIVKTKQRCRECVWWPGIDKHIENFVSHCTSCTVSDKGKHSLPIPPLKPVKFPSKPWSKIAIDIVGELHGTPQHARYLIVLIDLHSKWPEVRPVQTITTKSVLCFLSDLFARWGLPDEIISDNGRQFVSRDFEQYLAQLGIKHSKTALYHPQANGAVERFNRVIKQGIRTYKFENRNFDDSLRSIISNYRSTVQATTGMTPAELMLGRKIKMPLDLLALEPPQRKVYFSETLKDHVFKKQQRYKNYADKRRCAKDSHLHPGDMVRLKVQDRQKLDPLWSPPHLILDMPSENTAKLEDGSTWNAEKLLLDNTPNTDVQQDLINQPIRPDDPKLETCQTYSSGVQTSGAGRSQSRQTQPAGNAPAALRRSTRERHTPSRYKDFEL